MYTVMSCLNISVMNAGQRLALVVRSKPLEKRWENEVVERIFCL